MKRVLIFLVLLLFSTNLNAQNIGANIQSQFVIKGIQLCKTPVLGGYVEYSKFGITGSAVVTYGIDGAFSENLLILQFRNDVWSVGAIDYYYPYPANRFGNFGGKNSGSHFVEISGSYTIGRLELMASCNVHNDTTYSPYVQSSYRLSDGFAIFTGISGNQGFFYNLSTGGLHCVNVGFKYVSGKYGLTYYINPTADVNGIVVAYEL